MTGEEKELFDEFSKIALKELMRAQVRLPYDDMAIAAYETAKAMIFARRRAIGDMNS